MPLNEIEGVVKMSVEAAVNRLINYGIKYELISQSDIDFVVNGLLDLLEIEVFEFKMTDVSETIDELLAPILDHGVEKGLIHHDTIDERDLFDTKVMGLLMPRPSEIKGHFEWLYQKEPKQATDYFYQVSQASNYIRRQRIKKDKHWQVKTVYGELEITVNLSKPEKDPKTIALAKQLPSSGYPKCVLCKENVGYAGHLAHPARQNHRVIPVELVGEAWYLQYSPYVYYHEHCIVLKREHEPMEISRITFERLLAFVAQFKHYFAGSNADLPIVGGSILTHDHFQGGAHEFAMNKAEILQTFEVPGFETTEMGLLNWPLTTLRLKGTDHNELANLAEHLLIKWRMYSDEACGIHAYTDETPHQTITPIARFRDGCYELDLVLRNNKTSDEHPDGIFHPHKQYHHLKKENIGLIEVMGLAILPGRLLFELDILKQALVKGDVQILLNSGQKKHQAWFLELMAQCVGLDEVSIEGLIKQDIGLKFAEILACCGVYKLNEAGLAGVCRFVEAAMS